MKRFLQARSANFIKDERAQASIEYIVMIAVAVTFVLSLIFLLRPVMERLKDTLSQWIETRFFDSADFHRLPGGPGSGGSR